MSATTLVTFLMQAPIHTLTVDLYGSWDNFTKPYPMQRDSLVGKGHWRGCHSFTDIICDGELGSISCRRDGGLKMGGEYWYYYQLDSDLDYHNPAEPSTTSCPLLPGQELNVLEVPVQATRSTPSSRRRSISSIASGVFTLDPKDKYAALQPPSSATLQRSASPLSLLAGLRSSARSGLSALDAFNLRATFSLPSKRSSLSSTGDGHNDTCRGPAGASSVSVSWWKTSYQLRRTRSVNSICRGYKEAPQLSSTYDCSNRIPHRPLSCPNADISWLGDHPDPHVSKSLEHLAEKVRALTTFSRDGTSLASPALDALAEIPQFLDFHDTFKDFEPISRSSESSDDLYFPPSGVDSIARKDTLSLGIHRRSRRAPPEALDLDACPIFSPEFRNQDLQAVADFPQQSNASDVPTDMLSPSLSYATAPTGHMSPSHFSQPETPTTTEFGENFLGPSYVDGRLYNPAISVRGILEGSHNHPPRTEFPQYSLPRTDFASTLTLRNFPEAGAENSLAGQKTRKDLVQSWNDGSTSQKTAAQELWDDLSYLGGIIV